MDSFEVPPKDALISTVEFENLCRVVWSKESQQQAELKLKTIFSERGKVPKVR